MISSIAIFSRPNFTHLPPYIRLWTYLPVGFYIAEIIMLLNVEALQSLTQHCLLNKHIRQNRVAQQIRYSDRTSNTCIYSQPPRRVQWHSLEQTDSVSYDRLQTKALKQLKEHAHCPIRESNHSVKPVPTLYWQSWPYNVSQVLSLQPKHLPTHWFESDSTMSLLMKEVPTDHFKNVSNRKSLIPQVCT